MASTLKCECIDGTESCCRGTLLQRLAGRESETLSNAEILSTLLGIPKRKAEGILNQTGGIAGLSKAERGHLTHVLRILKPEEFDRLEACYEMADRAMGISEMPRIGSPDDIFEWLRSERRRRKESFIIILLGGRNIVLGKKEVAVGGKDYSVVHVDQIFRDAILAGAVALILVHNHPSGDPVPSEEDFMLTRRAVQAGVVLGIPVLDHIVIASSGYKSIREAQPDIFAR